jgi:CelD/BcsL family acetyltransferase involved in cellulose biosynthesis
MVTEVVGDPRRLDELRGSWDELAVARARPYASPGWLLPWWRHAAPDGARLRVLVALEDDEVVGVAPLYALAGPLGTTTYRLLGTSSANRIEPLARPGREDAVAGAFTEALREVEPRVDVVVLEALPESSPWPPLLAQAWPHVEPEVEHTHVAPSLKLEHPSFEDWFHSKGAHFRGHLRRTRRRLLDGGARFRLATSDTYDDDVRTFVALHKQRWEERGGSEAVDDRMERMLVDVGRELELGTRVRLWMLESEDAPIAAAFFVAAGGEVGYWLGGHAEAWHRQNPSFQTLLHAIEHAYEVGDVRIDLGMGGQEYKYRVASAEDTLVTYALVAPGRRLRAAAARAPGRVRRAVGRRLSDERKAAVKRALARVRTVRA